MIDVQDTSGAIASSLKELKVTIRQGLQDETRPKVWLFLSGVYRFMLHNENFYKEKLSDVFRSNNNVEDSRVPFEALSSYIPEEFSFSDYRNLSDKQIGRVIICFLSSELESVKRILYVICKREDTGLMYNNAILPDLRTLTNLFLSF